MNSTPITEQFPIQESRIIPNEGELPVQKPSGQKLPKKMFFFVIGVPTLALLVFVANYQTTRLGSRAAVPTPVLQLFPSISPTPTPPGL